MTLRYVSYARLAMVERFSSSQDVQDLCAEVRWWRERFPSIIAEVLPESQ